MPGEIKDYLHGYRANPKNKFGATDRMETLPTEFDKKIMYDHIRAMVAGKPHGVPQLSAEQLANMALHEGRDDFGFNIINSDNKKAVKIAKELMDQGHGTEAGFPGAILDKYTTAKRLNIPFEEAWNGTGKSYLNRTGADYAKEANQMNYAAKHPKNAELYDFVNRAINDNLTPQDKHAIKVRTYEDANTITNGLDPKKFIDSLKSDLSPNQMQMLKDAGDYAISQNMNNQFREAVGVNKTLNPLEQATKSLGNYWGPRIAGDLTSAALALSDPQIKAVLDKHVNNAVSKFQKELPETNTVTMPDNFRAGGRTRLI